MLFLYHKNKNNHIHHHQFLLLSTLLFGNKKWNYFLQP
jgi:hypothetical protein